MTLEALVAQLRAGVSVWVTWSVRSAIGPGWIGGGREVAVSVGGQALSEGSPALAVLTKALIARLAIPAEREDSVLIGEGELTLDGEQMVLDYEWSDAPVYEYGTSGDGLVVLMRWRAGEAAEA
ncbi:MAG: hypothetical protein ACI8RZ_004433 [Myxococcota bacterium]